MLEAIPAPLRPYIPFIRDLAIAILIFIAGWIVARIIERLVLRGVERSKVDLALGRFLASLARYGVLAAAVISSLGAVGIQTTSLVAVFASAGLAVGLALQGNLSHFASGVMILFFRPFKLGDVVTVAGHTGTVKDVGLFATTLHTPNNEKIIVANGKITGDSIINMTELGTRRGIVSVGVAYGADVERVQQILLDAVKPLELVLDDPAPAVAFVNLGASSLDFNVLAWSKSSDYLAMLAQVRKAIYDALNSAGIEIPFNQIVVHQAAA